jgi:hypothetical protein
MKKLLSMLLGGLLLTTVLAGQTPAPQDASADSHEKNINAYVEALRHDIRGSKAQIMGAVMQLDSDEATKFWPVYKQFEGELTKLGDQVASLVHEYVVNYTKMTPTVADGLATKLLTLESQRNQLKRKYYEKMKSATDAITAMRFLQVENQLERVIDLQVASELPVIQNSGE